MHVAEGADPYSQFLGEFLNTPVSQANGKGGSGRPVSQTVALEGWDVIALSSMSPAALPSLCAERFLPLRQGKIWRRCRFEQQWQRRTPRPLPRRSRCRPSPPLACTAHLHLGKTQKPPADVYLKTILEEAVLHNG